MSGPPGWLVHTLEHVWVCCCGCGPVVLSARLCPVCDDDPEGEWDWSPVVHHGREDCPVLGDPAAMAALGYDVLAEMCTHIAMAHYGLRLPDHTAMGAT